MDANIRYFVFNGLEKLQVRLPLRKNNLQLFTGSYRSLVLCSRCAGKWIRNDLDLLFQENWFQGIILNRISLK